MGAPVGLGPVGPSYIVHLYLTLDWESAILVEDKEITLYELSKMQ